MKRTLLTIIAMLALASSAQARPVLLSSSPAAHAERFAFSMAEAAARDYWGQPDCGQPTYRWGPVPSAIDTGGVTGLQIWGWQIDCQIWFSQAVINASFQTADFPDFCALMVHEWGHLFGHDDHATDSPASITYPRIGPANIHVAPCVRRYRAVALLVRRARSKRNT